MLIFNHCVEIFAFRGILGMKMDGMTIYDLLGH